MAPTMKVTLNWVLGGIPKSLSVQEQRNKRGNKPLSHSYTTLSHMDIRFLSSFRQKPALDCLCCLCLRTIYFDIFVKGTNKGLYAY